MEEFEMELKKVPIDKIDIGEANVRTENIVKNIDDLAESIKVIGLQQPPIVFPKEGGKYDLIIGQRRLIAMKKLGLEKVPVLIRKPTKLIEGKIASLSENIHRVKLSPRDMLDTCSYLLNKLKSVNKVAKVLGVSPLTVKKYLGYQIVPEPIKKLVDKKKLTVPVATRIAISVPDEEKALEMAKKVVRMTKPERERVFDVVREEPEAPVEHVIKRAEKIKVRREIIIHLSEDIVEAIKRASSDFGLDLEGTIETAVTDWLGEQGYL